MRLNVVQGLVIGALSRTTTTVVLVSRAFLASHFVMALSICLSAVIRRSPNLTYLSMSNN